MKLMIYVIVILSASISFVTVWGDCDPRCNPLGDIHSTTNSWSFEDALSIARCYSNCTGAGLQWATPDSNICFGTCRSLNPTCVSPSCSIGMLDTPPNNVSYIPYRNKVYRLSINFTDYPPGEAYVVRLFTNATNLTSYFFVLPVDAFFHDIIPNNEHYCNISSWSYAVVNGNGISNFSSPVEECLTLPVVTDVDVCFGLDLRPGYRGHFYAYVTWNILNDTATGVEITIDVTDGTVTDTTRDISANVQNQRSYKVQSNSPTKQLIDIGKELHIMMLITNTGAVFSHRYIFGGTLQCANEKKVPDSSSSVVKKILHPNCTYGFVIDVTLGYDPIVLENVIFVVLVMKPNSLDIVAYQTFNDPYNTARLVRPMYPEIENYTCQCERNYVHYTCESACTSMGLTGSNYTECLSSCDEATTSSQIFDAAALDPGDYEIDVQFYNSVPYDGMIPNSPPLLSVTFESVPLIVPDVIVDNRTINSNGNNVTLTLRWEEPFNNFNSIVNYTVSCSGDATCPPNFTTTDNTTRSYTITNLTPMTNYTFSVVATNSIGSGKAGVVMITTPVVPIVRFTQSIYRVNEDEGTVRLVLVLSHPAPTNITVTVSSIDKSAKGGGDDYVSGPFRVTIPAGQTNASIDVSITNDNIYEQKEKFTLVIDRSSTVNGVLIGSPRKVTVVIADDSDCTPCNVTRNVAVSEESVIVTFFSSNSHTTFTCRLDQNKSESCTSPMAYTNLSKGKHRIVVVAKCPCKAELDIKRFRFRIR